MKIVKKYYLLLVFLLCSLFSFAQQNKIDSLQKVLLTQEEDTSKVITLIDISWSYVNSGDYGKAKTFSEQAIIISKKKSPDSDPENYRYGIAKAYYALGYVSLKMSNLPEALNFFSAAVELSKIINSKEVMAFAYQGLSNAYAASSSYPEAIKNYFLAMKIHEEAGNKNGVADSYLGIGFIYLRQDNYSEALKNLFLSLKIFREIKNQQGIAYAAHYIGNVYYYEAIHSKFNPKKNDSLIAMAIDNYFTVLEIRKKLGNKEAISYSYHSIAKIYDYQGRYREAIDYFSKALQISEEIGDKIGIARHLADMGIVYKNKKEFPKALEYSAKSLKLAREVGSKEDCADAYKELSEVYGKMNEHKNRFENYKMYILYNDSISNEENTKKQTRTKMQYEFDKKEAKNKAEVEKREEIQKAEARKQRIILWSVISGLLLVVLFAVPYVNDNFAV